MKEKRNDAELKTEKLNGIMIMNAGFLIYILICFLCSLLPELLWVIMHSILMPVLIRGKLTRN